VRYAWYDISVDEVDMCRRLVSWSNPCPVAHPRLVRPPIKDLGGSERQCACDSATAMRIRRLLSFWDGRECRFGVASRCIEMP
jgi:hypothetical protein